MQPDRPPLLHKDALPIPTPCDEDWDAMDGDARRRFCGRCRKHVFDLSAMTRLEARALLRDAGAGRLCVRYAHDESGEIMLRPEPVLPASRILPARRGALGLAAGAVTLGAGLTRPQGSIAPPRRTLGQVALAPAPGHEPGPAPQDEPRPPAPAVEQTPPQKEPAPPPPPIVRKPPRLMGEIDLSVHRSR